MLNKIYACTHNNYENYGESKYLKLHCLVMNAINILEYVLPVILFLKCVLKTKCTIFNLICPHGSECLGISLVAPLTSTFCGGLILELISSQFSAAAGGGGGGGGGAGRDWPHF